jgi:uncharacterized protein DUF3500
MGRVFPPIGGIHLMNATSAVLGKTTGWSLWVRWPSQAKPFTSDTPIEGCPVSEFTSEQKETVVQLFRSFNEYYPEVVLEQRTRNFKEYIDETYFAWIGGFEDQDPYYYRIHSPVAFMEFDFHCGSKSCCRKCEISLGLLTVSSLPDQHKPSPLPHPHRMPTSKQR